MESSGSTVVARREQAVRRDCFFCSKGLHERCITYDRRSRSCCCGGQPSRQMVSSPPVFGERPPPQPRKPIPGTLETFMEEMVDWEATQKTLRKEAKSG